MESIINYREYYHTQEHRSIELTEPVLCNRADAWLGRGYYFWYDILDAREWGKNSKKSFEYFEIYKSQLSKENILDTVFNEEHYLFWLKMIETTANLITQKTGIKASIQEINEYFIEKALWNDLNGIQFQDLPKNQNLSLITNFYYRKRIQIVLFTLTNVKTFERIEISPL